MTKKEAFRCVPVKNSLVEEVLMASGDLMLSYPSAYKPFFSKIQNLVKKDPKKTFIRKIQLDGLGRDVWSMIDGRKNVNTIIERFAKKHLVDHKEAEISVSLFLKSLGEKGLIVIGDPKQIK
jgi:hypothetical protein